MHIIKTWNNKDVKLLKKYAITLTLDQAAKKLNRPYASVKNKATRLGISFRKNNYSAYDIKRIFFLYKKGMSVDEISRELNRSKVAIKAFLFERKIKRTKVYIKQKLNNTLWAKLYEILKWESRVKRRLDFSLTREEFISIKKMNCFYCGAKPRKTTRKIGTKSGKKLIRTIYSNGIDRIDSNKGYIQGNVLPCCRTCNTGKMSQTQIQFYKWIATVYNHLNLKDISF